MRDHLSRKKSCEPILTDRRRDGLLDSLQKDSHHENEKNKLPNTCEECGKVFQTFAGLRYHCVNGVCTNGVRNIPCVLVEDADLFKFGEESLDHIGTGLILQTFSDTSALDPTIVQYIYFHSQVPQNHTVVYMDKLTVAVFKNTGWRKRNARDVCAAIFDFLVFRVFKSEAVVAIVQSTHDEQRDADELQRVKDTFAYWTTLIERKGRRSYEYNCALSAILRELKENTSLSRVKDVRQRVHRPV